MRSLGSVWIAWSVLAVAGCAPPASDAPKRDPAMPGPGAARGERAVAMNRTCEGCHQEIARQWRGSMHQRAHVEPVYQRAFKIEKLAFCQACHAPEADPTQDPTPPVAALGVGCVTCHIAERDVLTVDGHGATKAHRLVPTPAFATAAACASCHEFAFPDSAVRGRVELMQSTVTEHAVSSYKDTSCAQCHMPLRNGLRDHSFGSSRNPIAQRAALTAKAKRVDSGVLIELNLVGVGHAFPTGDLFRRLTVSAQLVGEDTQLLRERTRTLARHFKPRRVGNAAIRELARDDRLFPGQPRRVLLTLGTQSAAHPIVWTVTYDRVEHPLEIGNEGAALAESVELAAGTLAVVEP